MPRKLPESIETDSSDPRLSATAVETVRAVTKVKQPEKRKSADLATADKIEVVDKPENTKRFEQAKSSRSEDVREPLVKPVESSKSSSSRTKIVLAQTEHNKNSDVSKPEKTSSSIKSGGSGSNSGGGKNRSNEASNGSSGNGDSSNGPSKPSSTSLLLSVQALKAESTENETGCAMIESKLLRATGAKAEALVAPGYQSIAIMLFNQEAYARALEAFDHAIAAYEASGQMLKLNKCAVLKAKTLTLLAQGAAQPQEFIERAISLLKNVVKWLVGPKSDVDPKEVKDMVLSSAYEMALAHSELGMLKWTQRHGSSANQSSLSALWKAAKWWAKMMKLHCSEKQIKAAFTSLLPIADMFQVLEYSAQQIAVLKLLATFTENACCKNTLNCELAQAYYAIECPDKALSVQSSFSLGCEHSEQACVEWRDRLIVAQAACLSHPSNRHAKEAREGVKKTLEKRVGVDPGRVRENFVGLAEAHYALAVIHGTTDLAEALYHVRLSERAWQTLFSPGSSSSSSSSTSTSSSAASGSFTRLSSTLKKTSVWRCLQGYLLCLDFLGFLYQRQGSVYHSQHVFLKGLELSSELGCDGVSCRFLLRLARLDCTRALLSKSEGRLIEVRQKLLRSSSSKKAPSSSSVCVSDVENLDPSVWHLSHTPLSTIFLELQTGELRTREQPLQLRPALDFFGTAEKLLSRRAQETELVRFEDALLPSANTPSTTTAPLSPPLELMQDQKLFGSWLGAVRRSQLTCMLRKDYDIGLPSLRNPSVSLLEDCLLTLRALTTSQPESELGSTWLCLGKGRLLQSRVGDLASVWEAKPVESSLKGLLDETKQDLLNAFEAVLGLPSPHLVAEIAKSLFELMGRSSPLRSAHLLDSSVAISAREHMRSKLREANDPRLSQIFGRQSSSEAEFEQFQRNMSLIPDNCAICTMTLSGETRPHLLVSHIRKGEECVVLRIPLSSGEGKSEGRRGTDILKDFDDIMQRNKDNLAQSREVGESGSKERLKEWWAVRQNLDTELQDVLKELEEVWLGPWKGILMAPNTAEQQTDVQLQAMLSSLPSPMSVHSPFLRTLFTGARSGGVERSQLEAALRWTLGKELSETKVSEFADKMMGEETSMEGKDGDEESAVVPLKTRSTRTKRAVPKKQDTATGKKTVSASATFSETARHPLILILGKELQHLPWESLPVLHSHSVCRVPSLAFLVSALSQLSSSSSHTTTVPSTWPSLSVKKGYYILNPNQDLPATQSRFEGPLAEHSTWKGIVSVPPSPSQFSSALSTSNLFVYIGHAGGQQFLNLDELSRVNVKAAALLMGCSSGSMTYEGDYETMGVPLSYLLSGCPLVVCNLWDVTDKDSDNLTMFLLEKCGITFPEGTETENKVQNLAAWMTSARSQCKLRYLNGAATICYGIPLTILSS